MMNQVNRVRSFDFFANPAKWSLDLAGLCSWDMAVGIWQLASGLLGHGAGPGDRDRQTWRSVATRGLWHRLVGLCVKEAYNGINAKPGGLIAAEGVRPSCCPTRFEPTDLEVCRHDGFGNPTQQQVGNFNKRTGVS